MIRTFIQARMSSNRYPGKVLAPFRGEPLIAHVIRTTRRLQDIPVVVATSAEVSDDPLVAYLETLGVEVFRGSLQNVFGRFVECSLQFPCDWILRISADSPLLEEKLLHQVINRGSSGSYDLVTTIFPRTFPKGQNAELIRVQALRSIDSKDLTAEDREHVTPFFYRHPQRFRIANVASENPQLATLNLAVDTVADLERLERLPKTAFPKYEFNGVATISN